MEKEDSYILMVMHILDNGTKIRLMVLGFICMLIRQNMKENGLMINKMEQEQNRGLMELYIKDNM